MNINWLRFLCGQMEFHLCANGVSPSTTPECVEFTLWLFAWFEKSILNCRQNSHSQRLHCVVVSCVCTVHTSANHHIRFSFGCWDLAHFHVQHSHLDSVRHSISKCKNVAHSDYVPQEDDDWKCVRRGCGPHKQTGSEGKISFWVNWIELEINVDHRVRGRQRARIKWWMR